VTPIGIVVGGRGDPFDDDWDSVTAMIRLDARFTPAALDGLDAFTHLEVLRRVLNARQ
jgi:tRNA (Thr-GGU) A37 N-methylase